MLINRKFYLDHLGCAKNQVDSEVIIASLQQKGWQKSEVGDASLIIINTCGFIESAKKESIDHFFSAHDHFPDAKIILTGCLAQRYGQQLKEEMPEVDGFFGVHSPEKIIEFVDMLEKSAEVPVWLPDAGETAKITRKERLSLEGSAYLKIAEGCRHRCTFCAIPLIRGNLRSRSSADILAEFKELLLMGVFEINLVAQDLSSYGRDFTGTDQLVELLGEISKVPGDFWVRLLYIHPDHFPYELLKLMQNDPRIIPYFDLPFQHASSHVLKKMGRGGSSEGYLSLIKKIRLAIPNAIIRSTFLLGFPGERDEDFSAMLSFQQEARLDWAGSFAYSAEEDTASYQYAFDPSFEVSSEIAKKRVEQFMIAQSLITKENLTKFVGTKQLALIEEVVTEGSLYLSRIYACAPEVDGLVVIESSKNLKVGERILVEITKVTGVDLSAKTV